MFRVLKPGGDFVFSDILQAASCDPANLDFVLARFGLSSLSTQEEYEKAADQLGLNALHVLDISSHLIKHYHHINQILECKYDELSDEFDDNYLSKVKQGMIHWIDAGEKGYLRWCLFHFQKS